MVRSFIRALVVLVTFSGNTWAGKLYVGPTMIKLQTLDKHSIIHAHIDAIYRADVWGWKMNQSQKGFGWWPETIQRSSVRNGQDDILPPFYTDESGIALIKDTVDFGKKTTLALAKNGGVRFTWPGYLIMQDSSGKKCFLRFNTYRANWKIISPKLFVDVATSEKTLIKPNVHIDAWHARGIDISTMTDDQNESQEIIDDYLKNETIVVQLSRTKDELESAAKDERTCEK